MSFGFTCCTEHLLLSELILCKFRCSKRNDLKKLTNISSLQYAEAQTMNEIRRET